jgi:hypothetical protein
VIFALFSFSVSVTNADADDLLTLTVDRHLAKICSIPTIYCVQLLSAKPAGDQPTQTCTVQNTGSNTLTLTVSGQKVVLSSDPLGTKSPYFDELAVLTVTAPSGTVSGENYVVWQNDCASASYKDTSVPTTVTAGGAVDISALFNGEIGTFELNIEDINKYNPYSNLDTYVCIGTSLGPQDYPDSYGEDYSYSSVSEASTQIQEINGNGLSTSMTVFVVVGTAIGSTLLILGIVAFAGFVFVKKSNGVPTLVQ